MRKCVGLAKKRTISSGCLIENAVPLTISFCLTCLGFWMISISAQAQEAASGQAKDMNTEKPGRQGLADHTDFARNKSRSIRQTPLPAVKLKPVLGQNKLNDSDDGSVNPNEKNKAESKQKLSGKNVHVRTGSPSMLVPPPPPDTPTMLSTGSVESALLMPITYLSPALLKKRREDLLAQLADAKGDLKHKQDDSQSIKEKAVQFKALFDEGVISKRELEAAEKEATEIDISINRAQLRVSEVETLLDSVNGRWNQINLKKSSGSGAAKKLSAKLRHGQ